MPQPHDTDAVHSRLRQALAFQQQGQLDEAELIYREILTHVPDYFDALHLLGIVEGQRGNFAAAAEWISQAIRINPYDASAQSSIGNALLDLKRPEEALASYDRALALKPGFAGALNGRGKAMLDLERPEEALASYDRALKHQPDHVEALNNRGNALLDLKRTEEALASYNRALALKPHFAGALNGCGNALLDLKRPEEALASYERALKLQPDSVEALNNRGNVLLGLTRAEEALASYDRALKLQPDFVDALFNRGNVLLGLKRREEALASYDRVIKLQPDYVVAINGYGSALLELKRPEEALASYDSALAIKPDYAEALHNRGIALLQLGRFEEGIADYKKLLAIEPFHDYARGRLQYMQLLCCDWTQYAQNTETLIKSVNDGKRAGVPFSFLAVSQSAADQLRCARIYVAEKYPAASQPVWRGERYRHDRIRLAYLSADFRVHPSSFLLAEMFENHDRSRLETIAISFGDDDQSEIRTRLRGAFEHFIDVRNRGNLEVARLMRELEVDIAVDLMGHTQHSRTGILALRPAPIQVNYLGFPGTMGAEYMDYIIADRHVIPEDQRQYFTEHVVYLPDTFQANDSKRRIAEHAPSRAEVGLPDDGFVFCSFNKSYKISPTIFDVWIRLLKAVTGSVLWLVADNLTVENNLRREAANQGIEPRRLIFAPRLQYADHLARFQLADLFLDTLPFNAGATASDALWTRVPVLTCAGEAFASRMAGSLLNAIGLPELITFNLEDYEALAHKLVTRPAMLNDIRATLAKNRHTHSLFNTDRFRRHIEAAYTTMWERRQRGAPPASFSVQPVR